MRHVTKVGIKLIKRFEGFNFMCPAGYSTNGYGHVTVAKVQDQFALAVM